MFNLKKLIYKILSFIGNISLAILSIIIVCLIGDFINSDFPSNEGNNSDSVFRYKSYKTNSVSSPSLSAHGASDKNFFKNSSNKIKLENTNKIPLFKESYTNYIYNEDVIKKIYERIIQNAISECIITNQKFSDFNSLLYFSKNFINSQIDKGELKLTPKKYLDLMHKINEIKNNEKLYKILCLESINKNILNKYNIVYAKYNIVSNKFLIDYHN
ncbi:hypothetical protein GGR55DRAFT_582950 [Xylaria sp. FL0064]|nr:hypothetical protein GGR55DRAFT_582950 [Xylaria sp. FL0064]